MSGVRDGGEGNRDIKKGSRGSYADAAAEYLGGGGVSTEVHVIKLPRATCACVHVHAYEACVTGAP